MICQTLCLKSKFIENAEEENLPVEIEAGMGPLAGEASPLKLC